ncbi:MAG: cohesin domain-containing protein [Chloroflexota bacterium]|nr:cohesin domain-containing protein [Chloroflexota bacterium]
MSKVLSRVAVLLVVLALAMPMVGMPAAMANGAVTAIVQPPSQEVEEGQTFEIDIYVDPSEYGVSAAELSFEFDPEGMTANSIVYGDLLGVNPLIAVQTIDNDAGTIAYAVGRVGSTTPPTPPGVFATISFTAGNSEDTFDLDILTLDLVDENFELIPDVLIDDGIVTIVTGGEVPELITDPDPPSHDFGELTQGDTASWDFGISNGGTGTLEWTTSNDQDWIDVSPASGTEDGTATVAIDTGGLAPGETHEGTITVDSNGGTKTGTILVQVAQAEPVIVWVEPVSQEVDTGEAFEVGIMVDPKAYGVSGGELNFAFDPEAMTADGIVAGDLLGADPLTGAEDIDNDTGTILYALGRQGGTPVPTSPGRFATISFTAGNTENTYDLDIVSLELADEDIQDIPDVSIEDGEVVIVAGEVPELNTDPDPPSHDFGELTQGDTSSWDFGISNGGTGTLEWTTIDDQDWIEVSPFSGTETGTATVTIDTSSLAPGDVYEGTITVDSNGGTKTGTIKVHVTEVESVMVWVEPASQEVGTGEAFEVDIMVDPKAYGVSGGELNFAFDPEAMTADGIVAGDLLGVMPLVGVETIDNDAGTIRYALARTGVTPVPTPPGAFATISFTAHDKEGLFGLDIVSMLLVDEEFNNISSTRIDDGEVRVVSSEEPLLDTEPDPPSHDFGNMTQGATASWDFGISNGGTGILEWTTSDDQDWIEVSPSSGTETGTATVTIDTSSLAPGDVYEGTVTVESNGGTKTGTIKVHVTEVESVIVWVEPPSLDVGIGDAFEVDIMVDPKAYGVSGGELNFAFDPEAMTANTIVPGDLLGVGPLVGEETIDNDAGTISYALGRQGETPVPTPAGVFATISFTADGIGGVFDLDIVDMGLADENFNDIPDIAIEDGVVQIAACSGVEPTRNLPPYAAVDSFFDVIITFAAPQEDFNAVGLTDVADDIYMVTTVDPEWCDPDAESAKAEDNRAEYVWFGPFEACTPFTAAYRVYVAPDTPLGLHSFDGWLEYYIGTEGPFIAEIGGDFEIEVVDKLLIGTTGEVACPILPECTVTVLSEGAPVSSTISDENGLYYLPLDAGDYEIVASKDGFKDESQLISVTDSGLYTLDFRGENGLIPEAPDMSYALRCVNHWLYPEIPCGLSLSKVLAVINAWLTS